MLRRSIYDTRQLEHPHLPIFEYKKCPRYPLIGPVTTYYFNMVDYIVLIDCYKFGKPKRANVIQHISFP